MNKIKYLMGCLINSQILYLFSEFKLTTNWLFRQERAFFGLLDNVYENVYRKSFVQSLATRQLFLLYEM